MWARALGTPRGQPHSGVCCSPQQERWPAPRAYLWSPGAGLLARGRPGPAQRPLCHGCRLFAGGVTVSCAWRPNLWLHAVTSGGLLGFRSLGLVPFLGDLGPGHVRPACLPSFRCSQTRCLFICVRCLLGLFLTLSPHPLWCGSVCRLTARFRATAVGTDGPGSRHVCFPLLFSLSRDGRMAAAELE